MSSVFYNCLEDFGDRPCLIDANARVFTYEDVAKRADAVAQKIKGFRKLVFVEAYNNVASIIAYLAALRGGHVVHLLNPCKPQSNASLIEQYKPHIILRCDSEDVRIEIVEKEAFSIHQDLAILLATSGSTGSQKLVKLSKNNIQTNTDAIVEYLELDSDDCAISSLKFHYSYGMSIVNSHLAVGGRLVLVDMPLQDRRFWCALKEQSVTSFSGVPHHFEVIDQLKINWNDYPDLRYITQAGGRLAPDIVKRYARECRLNARRFYVMYGQTEAAPRISYLPYDLAEKYPDCIGVAIPGGSLSLIDENAQKITNNGQTGQLVYEGPNVMVGYALNPSDLAVSEHINVLHTGDMAVVNDIGLYKIVGRQSRFVKPFGLRLNLDDIELHLAESYPNYSFYISGSDEKIRVFYDKGDVDENSLLSHLSAHYDLPIQLFQCVKLDQVPLMDNGKVDYSALKKFSSSDRPILFKLTQFIWLLFKNSIIEFFVLLLGISNQWQSVEEIFRIHFPNFDIKAGDSFIGLGGDSLKYIEVSLCLEDYLHVLPDTWHEMTVSELETLKGRVHV